MKNSGMRCKEESFRERGCRNSAAENEPLITRAA